jgi:hypothetical protein
MLDLDGNVVELIEERAVRPGGINEGSGRLQMSAKMQKRLTHGMGMFRMNRSKSDTPAG